MTCFLMNNGLTVHKYCKNEGISYASVYKRLEQGLSVKDSIKIAKKNKGNKRANAKYFYKGKPISETHSRNTPYYQRVLQRIYRGWSIEQAVSLPKLKSKHEKKYIEEKEV